VTELHKTWRNYTKRDGIPDHATELYKA